MRIVKGSASFKGSSKPVCLTIGNFDGVHLGHQKIFRLLSKKAKRLNGTAVVYTFDPHPVKRVAPSSSPKLIQTFDQKMRSLKDNCIDITVVEPFTSSFSCLNARDFFKRVIIERIDPSYMIVGHDLTFGRHRMGTIDLLHKLCLENGIGFEVVDAVLLKEILISSTQIRALVKAGDVEKACSLLGRPYALTGKVVKGRGIGGEIGFHTANIIPQNELTPPEGVYITKTLGHISVTNIGFNPTFGGKKIVIETHILNFSKKLYGKNIEVVFYKRIRDEMVFENPAALKKQIGKDIEKAKGYFK
ncbi:MAG: hypothetical protein COV46_04990 [Deltaproteobacteria bacterium CG11_big_fil_rev_8_21_14_0_20_49_13]|nr:MAG: hypothetical protein COV46_04990 [Deltaproteobacteria bacterium CG11_big_fil_rev_8_21_14_0_20_49_13]